MPSTLLHAATLIFEAVLGLFTVFTAYSLFAQAPASIAKAREALHIPRWYWLLAGCVATLGAVGLLTGLVSPVIGALSALWMVAYFVVAALTHVTHRDTANVALPLVFCVVFIVLAALRWGDLAPLLTLGR